MENNRGKCMVGFVGFVGVLIFFATAIDCAEVTTVYKFNTIRTGKQSVQYLNTCSVVVHLEDNHLGLPLFNRKDGNPLLLTILSLYNNSNTEQWQMEMENGTLIPLPSFQEQMNLLGILDPLELPFWQNLETQKTCTIRWDASLFNGALFNDDSLFRRNTVLKVTFGTAYNFKPFKTYFYFQNGKYISINFKKSQFQVLTRDNDIIEYTAVGDYSNKHELVFYISIGDGNFTIVDMNHFKVHKTGVKIPSEFGELFYIKHFFDEYHYDKTSVVYETVRSELNYNNDNVSLSSHWFTVKRNTSLFILYYNFNNNTTNQDGYYTSISVSLEEEATGNSIQLEYQDVDQSQFDMKNFKPEDINTLYYEYSQTLLKFEVRQPQNWIGQSRIRITTKKPFILIKNVWEGIDEAQIKISNKQNCVKSNFDDIYNVPAQVENDNESPLICNSGGQLKASRCICPPGFRGNRCETACNGNRFGQNCSLVCSKSSSGCKGMVLCTELYGCSCAPGYHGEKCLEQCGQGLYGADCKQTCSGCESGCDIYTGNCHGKCKLSYLIGPRCDQFYSYIKEAPVFLNSNFTSVELGINLSEDNIIRTCSSINSAPTFFMIQYREDLNTMWNNGSFKDYDTNIEKVSIEGLKPGRIYYFNVLILETLHEEDVKRMTEVSKGHTKCVATNDGKMLNATKITETSITISWEATEEKGNECPFSSYILVVEETGSLNTLQIDDIKKTSYEIENLTPAQSYNIVLKKSTVYGDSNPIASLNVNTLATLDDNDGDDGKNDLQDYKLY